MSHRRVLAIGLWIAALGLLAFSIHSRRENTAARQVLPVVGDLLHKDSLQFAAGAEAGTQDIWLLILSSSCAACLKLDSELDQMHAAARCANAPLLALIVERGQPAAAMRNILDKHDIRNHRLMSSETSHALHVKAVPTLMTINRQSRVTFVGNPGMSKDWVPQPHC